PSLSPPSSSHDTATPDTHTLSLHDALPILHTCSRPHLARHDELRNGRLPFTHVATTACHTDPISSEPTARRRPLRRNRPPDQSRNSPAHPRNSPAQSRNGPAQSSGATCTSWAARPAAPPSRAVSTQMPSACTATVCSTCAAREPSALTTVQSSSSVLVASPPRVSIGSTATHR